MGGAGWCWPRGGAARAAAQPGGPAGLRAGRGAALAAGERAARAARRALHPGGGGADRGRRGGRGCWSCAFARATTRAARARASSWWARTSPGASAASRSWRRTRRASASLLEQMPAVLWTTDERLRLSSVQARRSPRWGFAEDLVPQGGRGAPGVAGPLPAQGAAPARAQRRARALGAVRERPHLPRLLLEPLPGAGAGAPGCWGSRLT